MKPSLFNLCPNDKNAYSPVPAPPVLDSEEIAPLTVVGDKLVAGAPGRVLVRRIDAPEATTEEIAPCQGQPLCALPKDGGRVIVMSHEAGPIEVDLTAAGNIATNTEPGGTAAPAATPPQISARLYTYSAGVVEVAVDSVALGREYGPGAIDDSEDIARVQEAVRRAYRSAAVGAMRGGGLFQPVVVELTVESPDGETVYRGPRTLILPPEGLFVSGTVELPVDTARDRTGAGRLTVPTYRIGVEIKAGDGRDLAGYTAVLHQSPQIHTCDPEAPCAGPVTMVRTGTAGYKVVATLPGSEHGLSYTETERTRDLILGLMSHDDTCATPSRHRMDTTGRIERISTTPMPYEAEVATIRKMIAATVTPATGDALCLHRCTVPHRFSAAVCAHTASAVVWGNLRAHRFAGYGAGEFAADTADEAWTAVAEVTFADGTVARRVTRGTTAMPTSLVPVLSYPDPEAVSIDIVVESESEGAVPLRWTADLAPDRTGKTAISINATPEPRQPVEDTDAWITTSADSAPPAREYPGHIAVAAAGQPLTPLLAVGLKDTVTAATAATSTSGAWDFGRTRFVVFTPQRTSLVNVAADFGSAGIGTLATTGADTSAAVAVSPDGATFFAAGPTIYRVDGAKVKVVAIGRCRLDRLGYDSTRNELAAADSSGAGAVIHLDPASGDTLFATTSPGPTNGWLSTPGHVFVESQSGLLDIAVDSCRATGQAVDIKYEKVVRVPMSKAPRSISGVTWNIESTDIEGDLTVRRQYTGPRAAEVSRYHIAGRVGAPLPMALHTRPLPSAILEIAAHAHPETYIDTPEIRIM